MKKVLFTATVDSHILHFHIPYLKWFKEHGYEVHVATNGKDEIPFCDVKHTVSFERSPLKINNLKAMKQLKKIIEKEKFDIIHCHTPVASVITRIVAIKSRKIGTKLIYTAHGFHFYKGAPIKNWLLYYPIEKILSKYTDCLITITKEDYDLATKKFKKAKQIKYINGVGFNSSKFDINISNVEEENIRNSFGIEKDNIILTYVAELNKNKNQILLINVVEQLIKENEQIKLLLVGDGILKEEYINLVHEKNLDKNIFVVGKRQDIPQILAITDIYVASSIREGLPINIMEAMYMKLPIVALENRGHRELIINEKNGFIIKDAETMKEKILNIIMNKELKDKFIKENNDIIEKYKLENIMKEMEKIYLSI